MSEQTQKDIRAVCDEIAAMLIEKNKSYGDSALSPIRIFSKADAVAGIDVRIDDKLSRMKADPGAFGEDVMLDLLGYLVLRRIAMKRYNEFTKAHLNEAQWETKGRPKIMDLPPGPPIYGCTVHGSNWHSNCAECAEFKARQDNRSL